MPEFLIILLKINLALLLFGVAYFLVFRKLTFYRVNRLYLAFGILFSSVYPFLNLEQFFQRHPQVQERLRGIIPEIEKPSFNWSLLIIVFFIGVTVFLLRLITRFVSLYLLHRRSLPGSVRGFKVRILEESISPFSFWQSVYINPSLYADEELRNTLEHEKIHVREWHTVDILLTELSVVFYWFNPGVWMIKKAVIENLEFITDEKVLQLGVDRKAYQYSLLEVGNLKTATVMVNNFNMSDLRRRIRMMNLRPSSSFSLGRYMLLLPVILGATLAFTVPGLKKRPADTRPKDAVTMIRLEIPEKPLAPVRKQVQSPAATRKKPKKQDLLLAKQGQMNQRVEGVKIDLTQDNDAAIEAGPQVPKAPLQEITVIGRPVKSSSSSEAAAPNITIERVVVGRKMSPEEIANAKKRREEQVSEARP